MPYIDIINSDGKNLRYPLPEDGSIILIGSAEDCSISLPQVAEIHPHHCRITQQEEGFVLTAEPGATVLLDSTPTESIVLQQHEVYTLGAAILMYSEAPLEEPIAPLVEEQTVAAEEPTRTAKKKKKGLKRSKGSSISSPATYTEEDSLALIITRRLYVIAILALAFLAGLTLRYWMITGDYLIDELLK